MIQLLGVVGNLAQTFLEGKVEKEKAKSEIMKTAAQHDSKWNLSWLSLPRVLGKTK